VLIQGIHLITGVLSTNLHYILTTSCSILFSLLVCHNLL